MLQTYYLTLRGLPALAVLILAGCATGKTRPAAVVAVAIPAIKGVGINPADTDPSVSPCDDFFQFSGGNWLKSNPVPAYASSWGPRNLLGDRTQALLRQILEEAAANPAAPKGSNLQTVGDYYAAGMDSVALEKAGLTYLQPELRRIAAIKDEKRAAHQPCPPADTRPGASPTGRPVATPATQL